MNTSTPAPEADVLAGPNPFAFALLIGLNRAGKHIYGGTVSTAEKLRRRAAGKRQRAARKAGRR